MGYILVAAVAEESPIILLMSRSMLLSTRKYKYRSGIERIEREAWDDDKAQIRVFPFCSVHENLDVTNTCASNLHEP